MVKKTVVILLLTTYAFSSFGIGIKEFYCCGKLKSTEISFFLEANKKCGNGDESSGCCQNKYHFFKVKDIHIGADAVKSVIKNFVEPGLLTTSVDVTGYPNRQVTIANGSHAPPRTEKTSLFLRNRVFRI